MQFFNIATNLVIGPFIDSRITYIEGQFYDKEGRLAARGDERGLLVNCLLRNLTAL